MYETYREFGILSDVASLLYRSEESNEDGVSNARTRRSKANLRIPEAGRKDVHEGPSDEIHEIRKKEGEQDWMSSIPTEGEEEEERESGRDERKDGEDEEG